MGEDPKHRGRPLCQRQKINTLPGYLLIAEPDVELPATYEEIDKIKEFMANGFYYE